MTVCWTFRQRTVVHSVRGKNTCCRSLVLARRGALLLSLVRSVRTPEDVRCLMPNDSSTMQAGNHHRDCMYCRASERKTARKLTALAKRTGVRGVLTLLSCRTKIHRDGQSVPERRSTVTQREQHVHVAIKICMYHAGALFLCYGDVTRNKSVLSYIYDNIPSSHHVFTHRSGRRVYHRY